MRSSQVLTAALAACFCVQFPAWATTSPSATIKSGSIIEVKIDHQVRMRQGKPVVAHTVYPLYLDNRLVLPAGTEVTGKIAQLRPVARKARLQALERADFTPLHRAILSFNSFVLPDGATVPIEASTSRGGVDVVRFDTRPPRPNAAYRRPSRVRRMLSQFTAQEKAMVSGYAGLRRWPRFKRFIFSQLPLHPQYVDAGLQYTLRLSQPLTLPFVDAVAAAKQPGKPGDQLQHAAIVSAKLLTSIDSNTAVPGTPVKAIVTQPLLNANNQVEVPQNTMLIGLVTQAKPARRLARDGTLRFSFRQMEFPAGYTQQVHGTAQAVMAERKQNLQIDAEGGAKAQPKSTLAPIVLSLLAAEASHDDELTTDATASNGFAVLGHFMVLAPGSQYIAASMAAMAASHSIYDRFLRRGTDVSFPKDTRIEIAVDPVHSPLMHLSDNKQ